MTDVDEAQEVYNTLTKQIREVCSLRIRGRTGEAWAAFSDVRSYYEHNNLKLLLKQSDEIGADLRCLERRFGHPSNLVLASAS